LCGGSLCRWLFLRNDGLSLGDVGDGYSCCSPALGVRRSGSPSCLLSSTSVPRLFDGSLIGIRTCAVFGLQCLELLNLVSLLGLERERDLASGVSDLPPPRVVPNLTSIFFWPLHPRLLSSSRTDGMLRDKILLRVFWSLSSELTIRRFSDAPFQLVNPQK